MMKTMADPNEATSMETPIHPDSPRYVTNYELEAALGKLEIRLVKWFIGTALAIASITATLAAVLARVLITAP